MKNENIEYKNDGVSLVAREQKILKHVIRDLKPTKKDTEDHPELWTVEKKKECKPGALHKAGIAYALAAGDWQKNHPPLCWPFPDDAFKASSVKVENLIKAAAYLVADIDRMYENFQADCNLITLQTFGFRCFDDTDAYDLKAEDWVGISPEFFVRHHFKEDYELI